MGYFTPLATLKRDSFGSVELVRDAAGRELLVRRTLGAARGLGLLARRLMERERRALVALDGLGGVPRLPRDADHLCRALAAQLGDPPHSLLVREFAPGDPLHRATRLPRDFFECLAELVRELHARGVCHNDLHKEMNVLVLTDGRPGVIDLQLASLHARRGRVFASRCRDDLRHVEKHRVRYERRGRPKSDADRRALPPRSPVSAIWRRSGKPLYNLVTRKLLRRSDGEPRRPNSGPWPEWSEPLDRAQQR